MGVAADTAGKLFRAIDRLLAPTICPACEEHLACPDEDGKTDGRLCRECDESAPRLPAEKRCHLCGAPLDTFLEICRECAENTRPWVAGTCAFPYDGPAGEWIRAYKYGRRTDFRPLFVREMTAAWQRDCARCFHPDLIVPIPLHWIRQRLRGFNQAELLASGIARQLGCECCPTAIVRTHATPHQARLESASREKNLRKAFAVPAPETVAGKRVIVVDDVFTTGATLSAACRALLDAGVAETAVLAIARA